MVQIRDGGAEFEQEKFVIQDTDAGGVRELCRELVQAMVPLSVGRAEPIIRPLEVDGLVVIDDVDQPTDFERPQIKLLLLRDAVVHRVAEPRQVRYLVALEEGEGFVAVEFSDDRLSVDVPFLPSRGVVVLRAASGIPTRACLERLLVTQEGWPALHRLHILKKKRGGEQGTKRENKPRYAQLQRAD